MYRFHQSQARRRRAGEHFLTDQARRHDQAIGNDLMNKDRKPKPRTGLLAQCETFRVIKIDIMSINSFEIMPVISGFVKQ